MEMSSAGQSNRSTLTLGRNYDHNHVWRDINSILEDPDKSKTRRMYTLHEAGIGLAASYAFDVSGQKGIVIYLARSTANIDQISATENMVYIQHASNLIG